MTLRILIADDEPPARQRLRDLLEDEPSLEIIGEAGDGPETVTQAIGLDPDLLLLDIQMPGIDGFEVLEEIAARAARRFPAVVFVTAHDEYALRAFEAHAVDYLLKPFDRDRLLRAVARAERMTVGRGRNEELDGQLRQLIDEAIRRRPLRRLMVREASHIRFVPVEDIEWIEADGHYVTVHAGKVRHLLRDSLRRLSTRLDPSQFARIHRSTLVNLNRIREIDPDSHGDFEVLLDSGVRLRGTRTHLRSIEDRLS